MVDRARQRIVHTLVRRFLSYEEGFHLRLFQSTVTCRLRMANNIVLAPERYIHAHVAHFAVRKHRSFVTGAYKIHLSSPFPLTFCSVFSFLRRRSARRIKCAFRHIVIVSEQRTWLWLCFSGRIPRLSFIRHSINISKHPSKPTSINLNTTIHILI